MVVGPSGHDARGVADHLIRQGIQGQSAYTPLQVIKLTYLCHGWMLGLYGRPISRQPVQAWRHGPVIADVYHKVKIYGREPIVKPLGFRHPEFDDYETNLIEQVLEVYKNFSGIGLSSITHEPGTPWDEIYHSQGQNAVIPDSLIQKHFAELAKQ